MSERDELRRVAHQKKLQIAIDGPAGAGKTTVGKELARVLGCPYLDTGLMYRAITWLALERGIPVTDGDELGALAESTRFELPAENPTEAGGDEPAMIRVDGEGLGDELFLPAIEANVSAVSAHPKVRTALVSSQREFAREGCIVMIGRDIGTVVLPDAPVKIWVTASPEERARRRLSERVAGNQGVNVSQLVAELRERDHRDATRPISPSVAADNAVILDTGELSPSEMVHRARQIVASALSEANAAT